MTEPEVPAEYIKQCLDNMFAPGSKEAKAVLNRDQCRWECPKSYFKLKSLLETILPARLDEPPSVETEKRIRTWVEIQLNSANRKETFFKAIKTVTVHEKIRTLLEWKTEIPEIADIMAEIRTFHKREKKRKRDGDRHEVNKKQVELLMNELLEFTESKGDDIRTAGCMSAERAARFCHSRNQYAPALLASTGFKKAAQLQKELEKLDLLKARYDEIIADQPNWKLKTRFSDYLTMHDALSDGIDDLEETTAEAIEELLRKQSRGRSCYLLITHELKKQKREDVIEYLEDRMEKSYSGLGLHERFAQRSAWHKTLFDHVQSVEISKTQKRSAFDKSSVQLITALASCLRFTESYAETHHQKDLKSFLATCDVNSIRDVIIEYGKSRQCMNERMKSSRVSVHYARPSVTLMLRLFKGGLATYLPKNVDPNALQCNVILDAIPNKREPRSEEKRREFRSEEMKSMMDHATTPGYALIILLFREVALRVGAVANMKYHMLLDESDVPRHQCSVPEKNRARRFFLTSDNLKQRIKDFGQHFREAHSNKPDYRNLFLFNISKPTQPLGTDTIRITLKNIAASAKITGVDVHPHAFRHTIVGELLKCGNPMEIVSKFLGHRHVATTANNYFVTTIHDLTINNPYMPGYKPPPEEEKKNPEMLAKDEMNSEIVAACNAILQRVSSVISEKAAGSESAEAALNRLGSDMPQMQDLMKLMATVQSIETRSSDESDVDEPMDF